MIWLILSAGYAALAALSYDVHRRGGNWRVRTAGAGLMAVLITLNVMVAQQPKTPGPTLEAARSTLQAPLFTLEATAFAGERPLFIMEGAPSSVEVYVSAVSDAGLYHAKGCRYEKQMADHYRMTFESAEAAEQAGYVPCQQCCK